MATKQDDSTVLSRQQETLRPPPGFRVFLLNDDYTPMEFVIMVLEQYFGKNADTATRIMLKVHQEGKGLCGVYPKDIAATKVEYVISHARKEGHPLQCMMEEV